MAGLPQGPHIDPSGTLVVDRGDTFERWAADKQAAIAPGMAELRAIQAQMADEEATRRDEAAITAKQDYPAGPDISQYNYPQAAADGNLPLKGAPPEQFDPRYALAPDLRTVDEKAADIAMPHTLYQLGVGVAPPDFSEQYNTALQPEQESVYQQWLTTMPQQAQNTYDYDMRGAFAAGVTPDPETLHFPDTFKKPNHPTFSDESQYAAAGKPGKWEGDTFVPGGLGAEDLGNLQLTRAMYNSLAKTVQESINFVSDMVGAKSKPEVPTIGEDLPLGVKMPIGTGEQIGTSITSAVIGNLALRRVTSPYLASRLTKELVADMLTGATMLTPSEGETSFTPDLMKYLGVTNADVLQALESGSTDRLIGRLMNAFEWGAFGQAIHYGGKLAKDIAVGLAEGLVKLAKGELDTMAMGSRAAQSGRVGTQKKTVSTRVPGELTEAQKAKGATRTSALDDPTLRTGIDAMKQTPAAFKKNVDLFDTYATSFKTDPALPPEEKATQIVRGLADNLLWLHDLFPAELRDRAVQWYPGANKMAKGLAKANGVSHEQAAGVIAVLSPQRDWFKNMDQAKRVMETYNTGVERQWKATPAMKQWLKEYAERSDKPELTTLLNTKANDPIQKAYWVRAYDETMNDRGYAILSPEGKSLGPSKTGKDEAAVSAWGSFGAIAKGVRIIEDGSFENISAQLGNEHKVRNFYNNIIDPADPTSVTIDTHAVAAALVRALSGNSVEVIHNFGGTGAAGAVETGARGTYGIYHDAYELAAKERGLTAREMQSITWEAVRGLFEKDAKTGGLDGQVKAIWQQVQDGTLSRGEGLQAIVELSGGITPPSWSTAQ